MSSLSFVAISMQTTHLDPATVSQAAYLKMVDGQITRLDNIFIIPPTSEAGTDGPSDAVPWSEALSQLGMVIGKLPIVSYYRDADKEIFQAASRRSGTELPHFQWLDCRALARELLPDLPDHQPSTVLKALDIYDEHADSGTVEQTAQIVLKLAEHHAATTLTELWGDLYDQPDDLLDLEANLTGPPSPETKLPAEDAEDQHGSVDARLLMTVSTEDQPLPPPPQNPEDAGMQSLDELAAETGPAAEHPTGMEATSVAISESSGLPTQDSSVPADSRSDSNNGIAPELDAVEEGTEDLGDSTAQSVIESENLEQPEFLKVTDPIEPHDNEISEPHNNPTAFETTAPEASEANEANEQLHDPGPVELEGTDERDQPSEPQAPDSKADQLPLAVEDEPATIGETSSPAGGADSEPDAGQDEPAETDSEDSAEISPPQPAATTKPFDPVYQVVTPAPVPRPGGARSSSSTRTDRAEVNSQPSPAHESRKSAARTGRMWGILGIIVFGLLTIVGAILTVMATMLFFTANSLLLETKIAGVILTGAITLLSLLMTTLSYRTYRRK
ncbi:hypothetical protein GCM10023190_12820 [Enteractinococcus fodinae]|uniref:Uncharacterized protein n=1 Tax=Enteractinococcus fodinae TaxID=684663 RepID=A0ABU2B1I8_9MICC|nr:hypothetical protein [Enteractinococcus fodinae]MDR7346239.1 hypothetical protein [Enteractinococcus fodinae]